MTEAFLTIIIVVAVLGVALSLTGLAWPFSVFESLGRTGSWFHHADMDAPEALPDPNQNDPGISHRPLRSRY